MNLFSFRVIGMGVIWEGGVTIFLFFFFQEECPNMPRLMELVMVTAMYSK